MRKLLIPMSESVLYRLATLAEKERREPRQQAAYILEQALGIADAQQPISCDTKNGTGQDLAVTGAVL